jgi:hypothetical protein
LADLLYLPVRILMRGTVRAARGHPVRIRALRSTADRDQPTIPLPDLDSVVLEFPPSALVAGHLTIDVRIDPE